MLVLVHVFHMYVCRLPSALDSVQNEETPRNTLSRPSYTICLHLDYLSMGQPFFSFLLSVPRMRNFSSSLALAVLAIQSTFLGGNAGDSDDGAGAVNANMGPAISALFHPPLPRTVFEQQGVVRYRIISG